MYKLPTVARRRRQIHWSWSCRQVTPDTGAGNWTKLPLSLRANFPALEFLFFFQLKDILGYCFYCLSTQLFREINLPYVSLLSSSCLSSILLSFYPSIFFFPPDRTNDIYFATRGTESIFSAVNFSFTGSRLCYCFLLDSKIHRFLYINQFSF